VLAKRYRGFASEKLKIVYGKAALKMLSRGF
jgi:hypothetical protein